MATRKQQSLVKGFFATFLQENREQLNQKFLLAQQQHPSLQAEFFYKYLQTYLYPFTNSLAKSSPEKAQEFAQKGYELILFLLCKEFIGPNCKAQHVKEAWEQIFSIADPYIQVEPYAISKALTNAIINFHLQYQKPSKSWLELLSQYPKDRDWQSFLNFGLIASWRCGLAHYQESAQNLLQQLDAEELAILFTLPPEKIQRESFLQTLSEKPWLSPQKIMQKRNSYNSLSLRTLGGFSGYGREFSTPPEIALLAENIIITSGASDYRLFVDQFGLILLKTNAHHFLSEDTKIVENNTNKYSISQEGEVRYGKITKRFPELASYNNALEYMDCLLLTHPNSYFIYLVHPI